MRRIPTIAIAGIVTVATLAPASTALASTGVDRASRSVAATKTVTVTADDAHLLVLPDRAELRVVVPNGGCDRNPKVQVVKDRGGVVTVKATVTRPTSRQVMCTMDMRYTPVTIRVRPSTRSVVDAKSGEEILTAVATW